MYDKAHQGAVSLIWCAHISQYTLGVPYMVYMISWIQNFCSICSTVQQICSTESVYLYVSTDRVPYGTNSHSIYQKHAIFPIRQWYECLNINTIVLKQGCYDYLPTVHCDRCHYCGVTIIWAVIGSWFRECQWNWKQYPAIWPIS